MLAVEKMAGGIVSDHAWLGIRPFLDRQGFQLLAYIAHPRAEFVREFRKAFIISQQVIVSDKHRATASCVRHDRRIFSISERLDILTSQRPRPFKISGVSVKRAAANLVSGNAHRDVIGLKNASSGSVDSREQAFSDTACEQKRRALRLP